LNDEFLGLIRDNRRAALFGASIIGSPLSGESFIRVDCGRQRNVLHSTNNLQLTTDNLFSPNGDR